MATRSLTLDTLRARGDAFHEALSREYYLSQAGLKATAELQPLYAEYADILGADALAMVREAFLAAPEGSEERRGTRLLFDWLIDAQAQRVLAAVDEREIAWENAAVLTLDDGRQLPYQRAAIEIGNAEDRDERMRIERARAALVGRELAPLRRDRFSREIDEISGLDVAGGYIPTFDAISGFSVEELARQCAQFLRDTQSLWDDTVREVVRTKLGIRVEEATRADALALMRASEFDPQFPAATMEQSVRGQVADMGIDPLAGRRIIYDTGEREGKRARAFCAPVRVPDEVYLVLRPHGGQGDYRTLLHELGHALHFAYTRGELAFEYRWLGDNSVTEGYAMLFDHLLHDAGWLRRYTGLTKSTVPPFLRAAGFEELQFLRRYCGKLIYEVELYGGRVPWDALPDLYVQILTSATTFQYDPADAFVDVDPRFYAARYLRAWQLQAVFTEALVERFDADWWRNPRAGPWMIGQLFAEGQRELGHEIGARVGGALTFGPLIRDVERLLA